MELLSTREQSIGRAERSWHCDARRWTRFDKHSNGEARTCYDWQRKRSVLLCGAMYLLSSEERGIGMAVTRMAEELYRCASSRRAMELLRSAAICKGIASRFRDWQGRSSEGHRCELTLYAAEQMRSAAARLCSAMDKNGSDWRWRSGETPWR